MMALTGAPGNHTSSLWGTLSSAHNVFKAEICTESLLATTLWKPVKTGANVIRNDVFNTAAIDQASQL